MNIVLEHVTNPDIAGGYWQAPVDQPRIIVEVSDVRAARATFLEWRERNGLGAGNIAKESGTVYDGTVAHAIVSYNGRLWSFEGYPIPYTGGKSLQQATLDLRRRKRCDSYAVATKDSRFMLNMVTYPNGRTSKIEHVSEWLTLPAVIACMEAI